MRGVQRGALTQRERGSRLEASAGARQHRVVLQVTAGEAALRLEGAAQRRPPARDSCLAVVVTLLVIATLLPLGDHG